MRKSTPPQQSQIARKVQESHPLAGRLLFLLLTFTITVLVFVGAKAAFMLACGSDRTLSGNDGVAVAIHGLSLDLSTALYFLILPFLLSLLTLWWQHQMLCRLLRAYFALIAILFSLAFVADTSLYPFWGFKLDASCLQYLETPTEAMASVTPAFIALRVVVFVIAAAVIVLLYLPCAKRFDSLSPARPRLLTAVIHLLLIPVIFVGIRGGFDESTTNIGQVYFSQNQFLNHAAVNPVFSFLASMEKTASAHVVYHFMSDDECREITDALFPTDGTPADTLLNTQRPNVVVILLESCGSLFLEVMPRLRQLMGEGVNFANCYGNSYRTDRGTLCTLSGYPSFPTMSVMKMPAKTRTLPALAQSLRDHGYATHYLYGGDINFTNMRSYLVGTGFEQLTWKADYTVEEQRTSEWGVRDDITFDTLYDLITRRDTTTAPFLIGFSTLSTHEPWDVPLHQLNDEVLNAFCYLDQCIGRLTDRLKQSPQWKDLLIVLLPDHSINHGAYDEQHPDRNRIPMVWVGGAVRKPIMVTAICNQTDLPATLLAQMGIDHSTFTFSRDVMADTYRRPFAIHTYNNGFSIADTTGFMAYDLDAQRIIVNRSPQAERLARMGQAILQLTSEDLQQR